MTNPMLSFSLLQRLETGHVRQHALPLTETLRVSENDALCLWTTADALSIAATIWLSDAPFPLERTGNDAVLQAAFWNTAEATSTQERHFVKEAGRPLTFCKPLLNRFGLCRIRYQATPDDAPVLLATAEVESAKLTPDELNDLLDYLVARGVTYWRAENSLTTVSVSDNTAGQQPTHQLAQVSRDLTELEQLWPAFRDLPQTRLVPQDGWAETRVSNYSERSLGWLAQHPDTLRPSAPTEPGAMRWKNQYMLPGRTLATQLAPTTDTLENRALHGYLHQMLGWLRQQQEQLVRPLAPTGAGTAPAPTNANTLKQWQQQRYGLRVGRELRSLSERAGTLLYRFCEVLPVTEPMIGLPPGLAGFSASDHYFRAGQVLLRWYNRLGSEADDDGEGLAGVRTLDRLYELLCLFKLQDALDALGYQLKRYEPKRVNAPDLADDDRTGSYFFTHPNGNQARLHYEFIPDTYTIVARGTLLPDFILEYLPKEGTALGLVLDAKYRRRSIIVRTEFADLTLKYLHGLVPRASLPARPGRPAAPGPARTEALLILHPADNNVGGYANNDHTFYQRDKHDLFSAQPSRPFIGTVEVAASSRLSEELVKVLTALLV